MTTCFAGRLELGDRRPAEWEMMVVGGLVRRVAGNRNAVATRTVITARVIMWAASSLEILVPKISLPNLYKKYFDESEFNVE